MKFLLPTLLLILSSCTTPVQEIREESKNEHGEQFVRANRYMQRRHQDHIAAFVDRVGWESSTTSSGLWIAKVEAGSGNNIRAGQEVSYHFRSRLLDGRLAYESPAGRPRTIRVGQGGIESGVEEGLLHLQEGSRATLIIPPHLGHGNFGDRDKIPGNSVLLYELEIVKVR